MIRRNNRKSGQSIVEYIIIVVVVAIAALAILGVFSDTIRRKFGGAVQQLGGDGQAAADALAESSLDSLRRLDLEDQEDSE